MTHEEIVEEIHIAMCDDIIEAITNRIMWKDGVLNIFDIVEPHVKKLVTTTAQKAKADWLRSEIEKLEEDKAEQEQLHDQNDNCHPTDCEHRAIDSYITSIITRYKEELLELER